MILGVCSSVDGGVEGSGRGLRMSWVQRVGAARESGAEGATGRSGGEGRGAEWLSGQTEGPLLKDHSEREGKGSPDPAGPRRGVPTWSLASAWSVLQLQRRRQQRLAPSRGCAAAGTGRRPPPLHAGW